MWSATQIPHILRLMLGADAGHAGAQGAGDRAGRRRRLRRQAPGDAGGDADRLLVAQQLGKPVKYTETRSETHARRAPRPRPDPGHHHLGHARRHDHRAEGRPAGRHGRVPGLVTPGVPILGAFMFNAIYKIPAYQFTCTNVFTNKTLTDAYRGAGRPEATFAIERMMDELAAELGMDPMELREKNWIKHEEFPFTTVCGLTYDSGNYEAATAKAKELFDYDGLRAEQAERRERGDPVQLGIGISTFTEMCGLAPSRVLGSLSYGAGGWEHAAIRMLPTGKVEVVTGVVGARPGPRDGVEPDRRRPAGRAVRGRRGDPRRHPVLAQGHGHLRLALAGGRRHRRRQGRGQGRSPRPSRSPRTCWSAPRTTSTSPTAGSPCAAPTRRRPIERRRAGGVRRAQPARRRGAVAWTPRPPSTRRTSRSRTARTCARPRWTPRPAGSSSARTSASTTSARWSTR